MTIFKNITQSSWWQKFVIALVGSCAVFLGLEKSSILSFIQHEVIYDIDLVLAILFGIEIIIRLLAEDKLINFFKIYRKIEKNKIRFSSDGLWNIFDLILVIGSFFVLFFYSYDHLEFIYIARIFRVGRIFRLFEVSKRLRELEFQILSVFPTILMFVLLLTILLYSYAIVGTHLFGHFPDEPELMY